MLKRLRILFLLLGASLLSPSGVHAEKIAPDPLQGKPVLVAKETWVNAQNGRREKLIRFDSSARSLIRVEERISLDGKGGRVVTERRQMAADQLIVRLKPGQSAAALTRIAGYTVLRPIKAGSSTDYLIQLPKQLSAVPEAIEKLTRLGLIQSASPNYIDFPAAPPNDPYFKDQWGLFNTGQTPSYNLIPGKIGADIDWQAAWNFINPPNGPAKDTATAVVAILDSGIDTAHPDLQGRQWINTSETLFGKKGVDDDKNGYIDDVGGYDFTNSSLGIKDHWGHGTAQAGIIGAIQNNGVGITGIARNVRLMPVKIIGESKLCYSDKTISGIYYATASGAHIISLGCTMSFLSGDPAKSSATAMGIEAVKAAHAKGVLIIEPAGNSGALVAPYPSSLENMIRVAGTDNLDNLASWESMLGVFASNYGYNSVHLAAPTLSRALWINGLYPTFDGTSAAAPHVAGVAALIKSVAPQKTHLEIKKAILDGVEYLPSLAGKTMTGQFKMSGGILKKFNGGRLNALYALGKALNINFGPF